MATQAAQRGKGLKSLCIAMACAALPLNMCLAQDSPAFPDISLDAFGTLGLVHSSEENADFTRNILVPFGTGASESWSPKVDSVLAGQLSAHFTPQLSAVVQVVAEYRNSDSYRPRIEWANLRYEITPDLAVGVGRIASPIFMLTDTRRVSFALPWARPPMEVYELYPVTSNDGVNAIWSSRIGEMTHLLEVSYGKSDSPYSRQGEEGTATAREQLILRSTLERGALSFHVGFSPAKLSVPQYDVLFDAFRQFGPQGEAIAAYYDTNDRSTRYVGVGVTYDPGTWFAMAEWAQVRFDGLISSRTGHYLSAGRRFGSVTPYVIWASTDSTGWRSDPGLDLSMVPAESQALAAALNAQLNMRLADVPSQTTLSGGMRWDFAPNLNLKLQFDHIDLAEGNRGTLTNLQPAYEPGVKINLLGISLSFVL